MKIVFDHRIFTQQSYGGISRYFTRLMEGLVTLGHQSDVIAPIHRNRYLKDLSPDMVHGIEFERFPPKTSRLMMFVNDQLSKSKMRRMCPDIIHETYYGAQMLCPSAKCRIITVYDMIHEKYPTNFSTKDPAIRYKRMAVNRADHIISISHSTKIDLCTLYDIPQHKVSVVHLGYDSFKHCGGVNLRPSTANQSRPFLLYVGSRGGYKNFNLLLNAVALRPALKDNFDVLAFGGGAFNSSEISLICSLGFAPQAVRQIGGSDDLLGSLYSDAAAFIYPSVYEGFGLPPLEAMAHNCPVVTSNSSSMPEVVGNAGEYFDPLDIEAQSDAIYKVVFNTQRRNQLIDLGRQRLQMFSWERCAQETQAVYLHALRNKGLH